MRRSPTNHHLGISLGAALVMACMLMLALTPTIAARPVRDAASDVPRTHTHMRRAMRMENGIVTDDDGFIGNSTSGADHAPYYHTHRTRELHRWPHAHFFPAAVPGEAAPPPSRHTAASEMTHGNRAALVRNRTEQRGRTLPDSDADTEDGMIGDGNAEHGVIEQDSHAAEDGIARDDIAGDTADNGSSGVTEDGNAPARSVLPWIVGILVVLAAVLVVLALVPRRRKH